VRPWTDQKTRYNMADTLLNAPGTFGHSVKSVLNKSAEFASKVIDDNYSITFQLCLLCGYFVHSLCLMGGMIHVTRLIRDHLNI